MRKGEAFEGTLRGAKSMNKDDTIIIKAPQGTKTRWVRQSQAEGKKLSDWVREKVERSA